MNKLFNICIGLSLGILIGSLGGVIKKFLHRSTYSQRKIEATKNFIKKIANILKYVTFMCLALGFIWCVYFLILGIVHPGQADYANNMAELIVAILSVISILFAFLEFVRRKDDKNEEG